MPRDCTALPTYYVGVVRCTVQVGHPGSNTMAKSKNPNKSNNKNKQKQKQKTKTKVVYVDKPVPPMSIGAQIGDSLQKLGTSLFTKFMGTGDYTCNDMCYNVKSNALIKGSEAKAVRMSSDKSTFIFEHTEYIQDIVTSSTAGAFNANSFTLNPSNVTTFPWLSQLANSFETYELDGLIFRFVSTSGESVASTNTAIGTVMGTFVYDSLDPIFVSKQQFLQYDDTVDCKFSQSFICGVECDSNIIPSFSKKLYIGTPPANSDPKTYNYGNFVIATSGGQAASTTIGELWVSYRIKCHITKQSNYLPGQIHVSSAYTTPSVPFQTVNYVLGSIPYTLTSTTLTLNNLLVDVPYVLSYWISAGTTGNWTSGTVIPANCTAVSFFSNGANAAFYSNPTSTSTYNMEICFSPNQPSITITLPILSGPTGSANLDVFVTQLTNYISK